MPPVDRISTPRDASVRASSTMPDLSETLSKARRLAQFTLSVLCEAQTADLLYVNDYGLPSTVANSLLRKPLAMKIVGDFAWEYAIAAWHDALRRTVSSS